MPSSERLPDGPLLAYYGDDFTGSTDLMEVMASAGFETVLFLTLPTENDLAHFSQARCVGIAGISRAQNLAWMRATLPAAFSRLAQLGTPILQYKICSTFDSSPTIGSIGCAIDLGIQAMKSRWSPMIVGAPRLKRYLAFSHLFAAVDGQGYRLDRHPTMSRHPVTPMGESDLRIHLAAQTTRRIEAIDFTQLQSGIAQTRCDALKGDDVPVVLIDVLDEATLVEAGRLVWSQRGAGLFSASSSGLAYALCAYWRQQTLIPLESQLVSTQPTSVIAAVSGSCSPVTANQIEWARQNGFHTERLSIPHVLDVGTRAAEIERVVAICLVQIALGVSPIVYSAMGPDDDAVRDFDALAQTAHLSRTEASECVSHSLAMVMQGILDRSAIRRVVVAGGDSSGAVVSALGIRALTVAAALVPGAPLCRAWSTHARRDGIELVLKGGQMGGATFFGLARDGI
jgi:3-oxoisoapionate kinase